MALAAFALVAARADAAPEPGRALVELARAPLQVAGDVVGAGGLLGAATLASVGDALALVDDNRWLRGVASGGVHELARGLSWGGTQALELLRGEDVERWPEPRAAYRDAAPFAGRLDTAAAGLGALDLAVRDALLGPPGALLRAFGATQTAQGIARSREEAALHFLGPPPAPTAPDAP